MKDPVLAHGVRLRDANGEGDQQRPGSDDTDFAALFGLEQPDHIDIEKLWHCPRDRRSAGIPIGVTETGTPVELVIRAVERSRTGWYGQGLVVGDEDSGRAELLRAIVLGMALRQSPEEVSFVLVDVYGRGTFDGLEKLPHLSALVSGVARDRCLLDRLFAALSGESDRRLNMLPLLGHSSDMEDWARARAAGADLDPVPALVVVIDDFAGIAPEQRETRQFCATFARLGKVIRTHLLLGVPAQTARTASQSATGYHIVLDNNPADRSHTASATENADTQRRHRPHGYLHAGADPIRFEPTRLSRLIPTRTASGAVVQRPLLDVLVSQMHWHGPPVFEVLLPPLDTPPTLR